MNEWNREELTSFLNNQSNGLVYFYTPLCGTCQLASKMLMVIEKIVDINMGKINLNFQPVLAKTLAINSVPCLLFVKDGQIVETIYAFHSVPYLLDEINQYFN